MRAPGEWNEGSDKWGYLLFLRFGQNEKSVPELEKGAQDKLEEQCQQGLKYAEGRDVPQDLAKAARLFDRAAKAGHSGAQTALGWMYEGGAIERNYELH